MNSLSHLRCQSRGMREYPILFPGYLIFDPNPLPPTKSDLDEGNCDGSRLKITINLTVLYIFFPQKNVSSFSCTIGETETVDMFDWSQCSLQLFERIEWLKSHLKTAAVNLFYEYP